MVSGALLFPVRQPLRLFLKKRIARILIPLFVWSCVSVATHYLLGDISGETAIRKILCIPFSPVDGVYWFLYAILGLYLFAPLISPALENLAHAKYLLLLWGMTLVMPYVNAWIPGTWDLNGNVRHVLGSFSGYLGYMVLGYYLRYMPISWNHLLARFYAPGLVLAILIPAYFINGRHASVTNDMLYGYLTINVAALAFIYFTLIMRFKPVSCLGGGGGIYCCIRKIIIDLSQKSFGIYLIHILVMRQFLWPLWETYLPTAGYAVQIPVVAILTFVLCYLLIKLISLVPGSKFLF